MAAYPRALSGIDVSGGSRCPLKLMSEVQASLEQGTWWCCTGATMGDPTKISKEIP